MIIESDKLVEINMHIQNKFYQVSISFLLLKNLGLYDMQSMFNFILLNRQSQPSYKKLLNLIKWYLPINFSKNKKKKR
jgi:hypothetical protein